MDYLKGQGFILKTYAYSEADLVVHTLTKDYGLLHFFARGARKSKKRFTGGVLEPPHLIYFETNRVNLEQSLEDGKLISLKEAKLIEDFSQMRSAYRNIESLAVFNKVILSSSQLEETHYNQFGAVLSLLPTVKSHRRFFTHFLVRYLYMEGVLAGHEDLSQFISTPLTNHNEIDDVSETQENKEVALAAHFFHTYSPIKEKLKWPR